MMVRTPRYFLNEIALHRVGGHPLSWEPLDDPEFSPRVVFHHPFPEDKIGFGDTGGLFALLGVFSVLAAVVAMIPNKNPEASVVTVMMIVAVLVPLCRLSYMAYLWRKVCTMRSATIEAFSDREMVIEIPYEDRERALALVDLDGTFYVNMRHPIRWVANSADDAALGKILV